MLFLDWIDTTISRGIIDISLGVTSLYIFLPVRYLSFAKTILENLSSDLENYMDLGNGIQYSIPFLIIHMIVYSTLSIAGFILKLQDMGEYYSPNHNSVTTYKHSDTHTHKPIETHRLQTKAVLCHKLERASTCSKTASGERERGHCTVSFIN